MEQALSDRLRKSAQIRVLLAEPVQPVQAISIEGEPSRGAVNARVTLVEFTDFECPACAAMQPVLDEVLKSYGDRVRFVVRNYPLPKHSHARKAAEAADAAKAQGKFFEYTALLFKRQSALDVASLKKYATELGLERARFDAELDGGKYAGEVRQDIDDGLLYGVEGTPTIFVNGVRLREPTAEALRAAIERALGGTPQSPKFAAVPRYTSINDAFQPLGSSTYHALQTKVQKRFSDGLSFLVSYTLSKTLTNTGLSGFAAFNGGARPPPRIRGAIEAAFIRRIRPDYKSFQSATAATLITRTARR